MRPVPTPTTPTTQPTNRMGRRPGIMAARRNAGPSPMRPGYKKGGKVKGHKDGGCVMGKRGVRNTKML